jgi:hypothetical protein
MLHQLDVVLERLLTCKMSKCTFFSVRAEYSRKSWPEPPCRTR